PARHHMVAVHEPEVARDVGLRGAGLRDDPRYGLLAEAQRVHDLQPGGLGEHAEVARDDVEYRVEVVHRPALYAQMRICVNITCGNNVARNRAAAARSYHAQGPNPAVTNTHKEHYR